MTNLEKVQMHHLRHEKGLGYVQIAAMFKIKPTEVIDMIEDVVCAKIEFEEREPVVYRKHYVNPKRKKPTVVIHHTPSSEQLGELLKKFAK